MKKLFLSIFIAFLLITPLVSPMNNPHKRGYNEYLGAGEISEQEGEIESLQKKQALQQEKTDREEKVNTEEKSTKNPHSATTKLTLLMPSWTIFTEQEALGNLSQGLEACGIQTITSEHKWPSAHVKSSLRPIEEFVKKERIWYEKTFSHDREELVCTLDWKKIPGLEKITGELSKTISPLLSQKFSPQAEHYQINQEKVQQVEENDLFSIAHELRAFGNSHDLKFTLLEKIDQRSTKKDVKIPIDFNNPKIASFYGFSSYPKVDRLEKMLSDLSQKIEKLMAERDASFSAEKLSLEFNKISTKVKLTEGLISCVRNGYLFIGGTGALLLTNDEIEFVLAHELVHWYRSHSHYAKALCDLSYGKKCSDICHCFSRAYEAEADIIALEVTKKPMAAVTALLKSYRILTLAVNDNPELMFLKEGVEDDLHPTYYDRIMYALQQHEILQKETNS